MRNTAKMFWQTNKEFIMKQFKKGFTLIELMVVIVIIGILAAIAIPKLFGMTAKAKASELGPASGTWSKLQQAFMTETGSWGSFTKIAYKAPGKPNEDAEDVSTINFNYISGVETTYQFTASNSSIVWKATNVLTLGDCASGVAWTASFASGADTPVGTIGDAGDVGPCSQLTPNFTKLQ